MRLCPVAKRRSAPPPPPPPSDLSGSRASLESSLSNPGRRKKRQAPPPPSEQQPPKPEVGWMDGSGCNGDGDGMGRGSLLSPQKKMSYSAGGGPGHYLRRVALQAHSIIIPSLRFPSSFRSFQKGPIHIGSSCAHPSALAPACLVVQGCIGGGSGSDQGGAGGGGGGRGGRGGREAELLLRGLQWLPRRIAAEAPFRCLYLPSLPHLSPNQPPCCRAAVGSRARVAAWGPGAAAPSSAQGSQVILAYPYTFLNGSVKVGRLCAS